MRPIRITVCCVVLMLAELVLPTRALAQEGDAPGRLRLRLGGAVGGAATSGADQKHAHYMGGLRLQFPSSIVSLRVDGGLSERVDGPNVATGVVQATLLQAGRTGAYFNVGLGAYSGPHTTHGGSNAGVGIETSPARLRGRSLFVEGRRHAYRYTSLAGTERVRLTTVVLGAWW